MMMIIVNDNYDNIDDADEDGNGGDEDDEDEIFEGQNIFIFKASIFGFNGIDGVF